MDLSLPMFEPFRAKAVEPKKISGIRTISTPLLLGGLLACYERETERQDV
jgi:hypothetical protein